MNYNYPGLTIVIGKRKVEDKLPPNVAVLEVPNIHPADLLEWLEKLCILINNKHNTLKYVVFTYNPYILNYLNNLIIENYKIIPSKTAIKHLITKNYNAFINKDKVIVYDTKYNTSEYSLDNFHSKSLTDVLVNIEMQYFNIVECND